MSKLYGFDKYNKFDERLYIILYVNKKNLVKLQW